MKQTKKVYDASTVVYDSTKLSHLVNTSYIGNGVYKTQIYLCGEGLSVIDNKEELYLLFIGRYGEYYTEELFEIHNDVCSDIDFTLSFNKSIFGKLINLLKYLYCKYIRGMY